MKDTSLKKTVLKKTYDVTITLLSPMHIGSGRELMRDYDYVTHAGRTWVMDNDAFLEHLQDEDGNFDDRLIGRPPAELLEPEDFTLDSGFFRYVVPGVPRATGHAAVLREQYKDAYDQPYIPGSSLKGALRTILAWHGFNAQNLRLDTRDLRGSRSWAGQSLERDIFGRSPNYDLLRALQVADSQLQPGDDESQAGDDGSQPASTLYVANAQVVIGGRELGAPVELETIVTDTVFHTTLSIDEYLHAEASEAKLRYGERWAWLESLPAIARAWGMEHITTERNWHRARKYDQIRRLFNQMRNLLGRKQLAANQFFLQIGWGGGWGSKTFGSPLQADEAEWERLLNHGRLSPARMDRKRSDEFPKSRRVIVVNEQPFAPLGWCLVEMKER